MQVLTTALRPLKTMLKLWLTWFLAPADALRPTLLQLPIRVSARRSFMAVFILMVVMAGGHRAYAQSYTGTDNARIMILTTEGERAFTSSSFYSGIYVDGGAMTLKAKASTFLQGLTREDSLLFASIFNVSGNPVIQLEAQFPKDFKLSRGNQSKTVDVQGYMRIGGVKKFVTYPITLSYNGEKLSYRFDTMFDAKAWGLIIPEDQKKRVTGMIRISVFN